MRLSDYIKHLQRSNKLYFSIQEAVKITGLKKATILSSINYYKKRGFIFSPFRGFYIIIPLTEQGRGNLLPQDIILLSMEHLHVHYYVGLLSAARYHGATHQGLFVWQVVTSKRIKKQIIIGDTTIQFIYKRDIEGVQTENRSIQTGQMPISTPEETAKDLMIYYKQSGGVHHQATVLSELVQVISPKKIVHLAKKSKSPFWVQRMGFILDSIDTIYDKERDKVVAALATFLKKKNIRYVPLVPNMPSTNQPKNSKWKIIENTTVEADI